MATAASSKDSAFSSALLGAAVQAVAGELPMTLRLKNGEELEGVPTATDSTFGAKFGGVYIERSPDDDPASGPPEWTLTVEGRAILFQEVREFCVVLA